MSEPTTTAGASAATEASGRHPVRRALRLGVAGPVGTGRSSLIALVCRHLAGELSLAVITIDCSDEDARSLRAAGVLPAERIRAVETGAGPHTAIRDDLTMNLRAVEDLERDFDPVDVVLVESGGDDLAATFSPGLVDAQVFVLDVAGGGDDARTGGPGIARDGAPVLVLSRGDRASVEKLCTWVRELHREHTRGARTPTDPGPMAPHSPAPARGDEPSHGHAPDDGDVPDKQIWRWKDDGGAIYPPP